MTDKLTFGDRLKITRKLQNLSQRELAAKIGVSQSVINSYEHNDTYPSLVTFKNIVKELNVSSDDLLDCTNTNKNTDFFELLKADVKKIIADITTNINGKRLIDIYKDLKGTYWLCNNLLSNIEKIERKARKEE